MVVIMSNALFPQNFLWVISSSWHTSVPKCIDLVYFCLYFCLCPVCQCRHIHASGGTSIQIPHSLILFPPINSESHISRQ